MPANRVQKPKASRGSGRRARGGARARNVIGSISTPIVINDDDNSEPERAVPSDKTRAPRSEAGSDSSPIVIEDEEAPIIIVDDEGDVSMQSTPSPKSSVELGKGIPVTEMPTPGPEMPTPGPGRTLRFRGLALSLIGHLYPNAQFEIHRIGYTNKFDITQKGSELLALRALIDTTAIYRVTMTECDVPTEPDGPLMWSRKYEGPEPLTSEEYINILKLSTRHTGKMSFFSYFAPGENASWGLFRQVPGRDYTLSDCFDTIRVPENMRSKIQGFGPLMWRVGGAMPHLYIGKDMPVRAVRCKIRETMKRCRNVPRIEDATR